MLRALKALKALKASKRAFELRFFYQISSWLYSQILTTEDLNYFNTL